MTHDGFEFKKAEKGNTVYCRVAAGERLACELSGKLSFPLRNLLIVLEADALELKRVENVKSVCLRQSRAATRLVWSRSEWLPEPR